MITHQWMAHQQAAHSARIWFWLGCDRDERVPRWCHRPGGHGGLVGHHPKPPIMGIYGDENSHWVLLMINFSDSVWLPFDPRSIIYTIIYTFQLVWIGTLEFLNPLQMMDYKRWLPIEFGYSTVCYSYTHCFFLYPATIVELKHSHNYPLVGGLLDYNLAPSPVCEKLITPKTKLSNACEAWALSQYKIMQTPIQRHKKHKQEQENWPFMIAGIWT